MSYYYIPKHMTVRKSDPYILELNSNDPKLIAGAI